MIVYVLNADRQPLMPCRPVIARLLLKAGKGKRSKKAMPPAKIFDFRKFDHVAYLGQKAFIKGRMSTGYTILMDIRGEVLNFGHVPKMRAMKQLTTRRSTLIASEPMQLQSIGAFSPDGRNSSPT